MTFSTLLFIFLSGCSTRIVPLATLLASSNDTTSAASSTPLLSLAGIDVVTTVRGACLLNNGAVYCWGQIDTSNGAGSAIMGLVPTLVTGWDSGVTQISAGPENVCAVKAGVVSCIGNNSDSQMGNNAYVTNTDNIKYTTPVTVMSGIASISVGSYHTCAVTTGADLKCWGGNYSGYFGIGTYTNYYDASVAPVLTSNVAEVAVSPDTTCIRTLTGDVLCAGYNSVGEVGQAALGGDIITFTLVPLPSQATALYRGAFHFCARLTTGALYCWGYGGFGEMANTTKVVSNGVPALASLIPADADKIFLQVYRTCYTKAGLLYCAGSNENSILQNPAATSWSYEFAALLNISLTGVGGVSTGLVWGSPADDHSCAITQTGIQCWGANDYGQIGNGVANATNVSTPVTVFTY